MTMATMNKITNYY